MKLLTILAFVASFGLAISACTDEEGTIEALQAEGFTNVRTTGYSLFGCSKDDTTCTSFEALGPPNINGSHRLVKGVVGCGLVFKGCTVRITH